MNVEKFLTGGVYRQPQIDGEIKIEPLFNAHKLANLCLSEAVDGTTPWDKISCLQVADHVKDAKDTKIRDIKERSDSTLIRLAPWPYEASSRSCQRGDNAAASFLLPLTDVAVNGQW